MQNESVARMEVVLAGSFQGHLKPFSPIHTRPCVESEATSDSKGTSAKAVKAIATGIVSDMLIGTMSTQLAKVSLCTQLLDLMILLNLSLTIMNSQMRIVQRMRLVHPIPQLWLCQHPWTRQIGCWCSDTPTRVWSCGRQPIALCSNSWGSA